jgi:TAG lipase / lysophosphatidylethanolamine acyltransferase
MCHIGVVKALYLRGLLPRIITGTATGALVAALVGVHTDDELLEVLTGKGIDLSSFQRSRTRRRKLADDAPSGTKWLQAVRRRSARFLRTGHIFNIRVLEECAQDNLGDLTFEEAYSKTGRILNVTVALPNEVGIPQLLNYITAPHVLIWSAVVASTATSKTFYAPVQLYCKNETGTTEPFAATDLPALRSTTHLSGAQLREAPLKRIGELFNVNHFIVSQTRPYIAPFVRAEQNYPTNSQYTTLPNSLVRLLSSEVFHLLTQLNSLGWLPTSLCRLLMDETIPSNSRWAKISLTPDLTVRDLLALFDTPTEHLLDEWIRRGERSVWPAVPELRVRCGIEFELERAYESVRRRSPEQLGVEFAG